MNILTLKSINYNDFSFEFMEYIKNKSQLFNSSSSTIICDSNTDSCYIMNIRVVNYYLDSKGESHINCDNTITYNKIIYIDKKFNIIREQYMITDLTGNIPYYGIEDIRLFHFKDAIYFIGSSYNEKTKKIQIVSNILDLSNNYFEPKFINPSFQTNYDWEKNWVFFNNNGKINVIYKWYPIYICSIDYETQQLNLIQKNSNVPTFFERFRGSTNGVEYDNKIWFIVHFHKKRNKNKPEYIHNFVVFDTDMNLLGYSNPFKFENFIVEYCIGMILNEDNNFIITYSTLDKTSKLIVLDKKYVKSLIIPVY